MAKYYISGVWKNSNSVITHYLIHKTDAQGEIVLTQKLTKARAIAKLDLGHTAVTVVWDYLKVYWIEGEDVEVVDSDNGRYLRTRPDNLGHLVNYGEMKIE